MQDYRYLKVQRTDDAIVATVTCASLTDEVDMDQFGLELHSLCSEDDPRRIVLDMSGVQYWTSTALGKLIALHRRQFRLGCELILCNLTETAREILQTSRLMSYFQVVDSVEDCLNRDEERVRLACPLAQCGGRSEPVDRQAVEENRALTCQRCAAVFVVKRVVSSAAGELSAEVATVSIPTYEAERIELAVGAPHFISVVGRATLFALDEPLFKAWSTIPPPRRIVFDLRRATDLTAAGAETLQALCRRKDDDSRCVILASGGESEAGLLPMNDRLVFSDAADAVEALGNIPDAAKRPLFVVGKSLVPGPERRRT